jgi:hypothetical protein
MVNLSMRCFGAAELAELTTGASLDKRIADALPDDARDLAIEGFSSISSTLISTGPT